MLVGAFKHGLSILRSILLNELEKYVVCSYDSPGICHYRADKIAECVWKYSLGYHVFSLPHVCANLF